MVTGLAQRFLESEPQVMPPPPATVSPQKRSSPRRTPKKLESATNVSPTANVKRLLGDADSKVSSRTRSSKQKGAASHIPSPRKQQAGETTSDQQLAKNVWLKKEVLKVESTFKSKKSLQEDVQMQQQQVTVLSHEEIEGKQSMRSQTQEWMARLRKQKAHIESTCLMESDNEDAYPTLERSHGNPFVNIPKRVLAVLHSPISQSVDPITSPDQVETLYLVSYKQDYQKVFITPSVVPSDYLKALNQHDLIFRFYDSELKVSILQAKIEELDTQVTLLDEDLKDAPVLPKPHIY